MISTKHLEIVHSFLDAKKILLTIDLLGDQSKIILIELKVLKLLNGIVSIASTFEIAIWYTIIIIFFLEEQENRNIALLHQIFCKLIFFINTTNLK